MFHIRKDCRVLKQLKNQYLKQTYLRWRRLPSFSRFFRPFFLSFWESFWNLQYLTKMRAKMKYTNHQIKKCLLFRCRHAVVIMQILNWTNQCWLFMTVRYIMRSGRMATHRNFVGEPRPRWTLDFANAFVSPGVNSRGELVPSSARGLIARKTVCSKLELEVPHHDQPLGDT